MSRPTRRHQLGEGGAVMTEHDQIDPQDMADQLAERSERIGAMRDAAFERGYEDYERDGDVEVGAVLWNHPKLEQDYRDGWSEAQEHEEEMDADSYACSLDPSMRDTHGTPGDM